jgi:hypothetical protein
MSDRPPEADERLIPGPDAAPRRLETPDDDFELLPTPSPPPTFLECPSCGKELRQDNFRDDPYCPYCGVIPRARLPARGSADSAGAPGAVQPPVAFTHRWGRKALREAVLFLGVVAAVVLVAGLGTASDAAFYWSALKAAAGLTAIVALGYYLLAVLGGGGPPGRPQEAAPVTDEEIRQATNRFRMGFRMVLIPAAGLGFVFLLTGQFILFVSTIGLGLFGGVLLAIFLSVLPTGRRRSTPMDDVDLSKTGYGSQARPTAPRAPDGASREAIRDAPLDAAVPPSAIAPPQVDPTPGPKENER